MTTYKKQLKDKDGNTIYPDVGLNLDDVVYSDDPTTPIGEVTNPFDYSTNETRIGTWIDGKPIYRKVINIASPSTSNTDYDLVSSDISTLVRLWGYMVASDDTKIPVPQMDNATQTYSVVFLRPTGALRGRFSFAGTAPSAAVVIVEYTKTTD